MPEFDVVLRNARVIDPESGLDATRDAQLVRHALPGRPVRATSGQR